MAAPAASLRVAGRLRLVSAASLGPLAAFRQRAGLPVPAPLAGPGAGRTALPLVFGGRLWEATALETGDPGVALRVSGGSQEMPLGRIAARAATVGEGLAAAARASADYCAGQLLWLERIDSDVCLHRRISAHLRRGRRQVNDFALKMVIDLVRRGAGPDWKPTGLRLEGSPPPHAEELAELASGPVRFGEREDTLVFPREILELPLPPPSLVSPESARLPPTDFEGSARLAVRALLELGELTLPHLAEAAGTSIRTLQRRLALAGLSFGDLVEDARFEVASRLLLEPGVRVIDVASELGYTDSANFTRAFRRWAGVPPRAFRSAAGVK